MFENIVNFFKRFGKNEKENSKNTAKERLHLVLAQDRANISADFLEMMKQEIIDVIKKYIDIDEEAIDVRMTNKPGEDGIVGAPALYANIPIVTIKNEARKLEGKLNQEAKTEKEKAVITENENKQEVEKENNLEGNEKEEVVESKEEEKTENEIKEKEVSQDKEKEESKEKNKEEEKEIDSKKSDQEKEKEANKKEVVKNTSNAKNKKKSKRG